MSSEDTDTGFSPTSCQPCQQTACTTSLRICSAARTEVRSPYLFRHGVRRAQHLRRRPGQAAGQRGQVQGGGGGGGSQRQGRRGGGGAEGGGAGGGEGRQAGTAQAEVAHLARQGRRSMAANMTLSPNDIRLSVHLAGLCAPPGPQQQNVGSKDWTRDGHSQVVVALSAGSLGIKAQLLAILPCRRAASPRSPPANFLS